MTKGTWAGLGVALVVAAAVGVAVLVTRPSPVDVMPRVVEIEGATRARVAAAAVGSPAVQHITGNRPLRVVEVVSSGIGGQFHFAQVYLELVDGPVTLTGQWPRAVIDDCPTCKPNGPLRWHIESPEETYTVHGILANVDLHTTAVTEIRPSPDPMSPTTTAPPRPTAG